MAEANNAMCKVLKKKAILSIFVSIYEYVTEGSHSTKFKSWFSGKHQHITWQATYDCTQFTAQQSTKSKPFNQPINQASRQAIYHLVESTPIFWTNRPLSSIFVLSIPLCYFKV
jgi:hypothetical protein